MARYMARSRRPTPVQCAWSSNLHVGKPGTPSYFCNLQSNAFACRASTSCSMATRSQRRGAARTWAAHAGAAEACLPCLKSTLASTPPPCWPSEVRTGASSCCACPCSADQVCVAGLQGFLRVKAGLQSCLPSAALVGALLLAHDACKACRTFYRPSTLMSSSKDHNRMRR